MKKANHTYKDYERALKTQKERYINRVNEMMRENISNCYFLTFTFTEKTLNKTNEKTRLRAVKDFLNKQASKYMLNIDYGKTNNREHYHAVILSKYKVIVFDAFKYGYIKARKLLPTLNRPYLAELTAEKLTKHAFKETTRQAKIIYSRATNKINRAFSHLANIKLAKYRNSDLGKNMKELYNENQATMKQLKADYDELNKLFDYLDNPTAKA